MLLVVSAPTERPVAGYVGRFLPLACALVNRDRTPQDHPNPEDMMRSYDEILAIAAARKGGVEAVLADIPVPKTPDELAAIPEDRWLAQFARGILQAGISWTVVDRKWPGIEEAFLGFDITAITFQPEGWAGDLCNDPRIIRSPPKVQAILDNAAFLRRVRDEYGSFGRRIGDWPDEDFAGLIQWLQTEGARLGGNTGAYALRQMGKDSYLMSQDVVARLVAEGVVDKAPSSKKAWAAVQAAFNLWQGQSGQSLTVISRVLAQSL